MYISLIKGDEMRRITVAAFALLMMLSACNTLKNAVDASSDLSKLAGTWELNYVSGPRIAFNGLYPGKKPMVTFDLAEKRMSGQQQL